MAFWDNPTIDEASKNCEESENALRLLFTRANGFILRLESPDYGVDFNIEIANDNSPTGKMLAIQLKSKNNLTIITKKELQFVVLPFKTSRLGYLFRRIPMYGIVVLYDMEKSNLYFDYVENLIARINDERGDDSWKENETVNLHIPIENVLDSLTIKSIHSKMLNRARQADALIAAFGQNFQIPSSQQLTDFPDSKLLSIDDLEKFGLAFAYKFEFDLLYKNLENLRLNQIIGSLSLVHLAALVYTERGKAIEAEYYIRKAFQHKNEYSKEEFQSISFLKIRVDTVLGNIDELQCLQLLTHLQQEIVGIQNFLMVKLNILNLKVRLADVRDKDFPQIIEEINSFFKDIDDSNLDRSQKIVLSIHNCENLSAAFTIYNAYKISQFKLKESLGVKVEKSDTVYWITKMGQLNQTVDQRIDDAIIFSKQSELLVPYAKALHLRAVVVKNFISSLLLVREELPEVSEGFASLDKARKCADASFDLHDKSGLTYDAYSSLLVRYDIQRLIDVLVYKNRNGDNSKLLEKINAYKQNNDIQEDFYSSVDALLEKLVLTRDTSLVNKTDEEITEYANIMAIAQGFDKIQTENLLNDIKAHQIFETYCKSSDILLRHKMPQSDPTFKYRWPPTYALIGAKTGIEYASNQDIYRLLAKVGIEVPTRSDISNSN